MAVIINEFEIIPDDAQSTEDSAEEPIETMPQSAPALAPADVEAIIQHQAERELRLRAH